MAKKVISIHNMPTRLPVNNTLIAWLVMDRLHPAQWIWGTVGVFYLFLWIAFIYGIHNENGIDALDSGDSCCDKNSVNPTKSQWQQRLDDTRKAQEER